MMEVEKMIIEQTKYRIGEESIPRIVKCLHMLTLDQIWSKPNENTNSIGNLILHLEGNVSQWIFSTLGTMDDNRNRDAEFESTLQLSKDELLIKLNALKTQLIHCMDAVAAVQLTNIHKVQCYEETGISILVHVIEHFSYHTGQITLLTKLMTNTATHYYDGDLLNQTN